MKLLTPEKIAEIRERNHEDQLWAEKWAKGFVNRQHKDRDNLLDHITALEEGLRQIERGCSFPEDDVQKAILTVVRPLLKQEQE